MFLEWVWKFFLERGKMQNPSFINFTPSVNPLVQGYDFAFFLEDNTPITGAEFHVDLAHLAVQPNGTLSFSLSSLIPLIQSFQNQNMFAKVNAYGPNNSVSLQVNTPLMSFVFLDPPTNVILL